MKIKLANPRGFCAGVDRAIDIVNRAIEIFGAPIYVRHEVVHNKYVIEELEMKGAIFVDEVADIPSDVPTNTVVIFSAHGVSPKVRQEAQARKLQIFDATCPLVTKVHMEVVRYSRSGEECILIGHAGHPEVEGTMGQYNKDYGGNIYLVETEADLAKLAIQDHKKIAYVTQTTLSVDDTAKIIDALRKKFPHIHGPNKEDICYATTNRQEAVKNLAQSCDVILVVGSANSSNSNRLKEISEVMGARSYLIDDVSLVNRSWFKESDIIGVTAGASAPEILVKHVIEKLQEWGATSVDEISGREETITFSLPRTLRN